MTASSNPEDVLEVEQNRSPIRFLLSGRIDRDEIPALRRKLLAFMAGGPVEGRSYVVLDVSNLESDLAAVDALARLRLTAQQGGHDIQIGGASLELRRLIALFGLLDILPLDAS